MAATAAPPLAAEFERSDCLPETNRFPDLTADEQQLTAQGFRLFNAGDPKGAAAAFRQALELNPASADLHHNLAAALAKLEMFEAAFRHFEQSLVLRPNSADTYRNLALALGKTRR